MYIEPKVYRGFSVFRLIMGILGFLSTIVFGIVYFHPDNYDKILGIPTELLPDDLSRFLYTYLGIMGVVMIITSAIALLFSYMDFSSMFQFADLIEQEQRKDDRPINKRSFVFAPKTYRNFGTVIFTINFIVSAFAALGIVIANSIANSVFVAVPLVPISLMALYLFFVYITYCMRYKAFGDVLELAMEPNQNNPSVAAKESLIDNKTNLLRGWGTFLFACCFLVTALAIASIVLIITVLPVELHFILILISVISWILSIINLFVTSCFYDNLATMIERRLIKYNLIQKYMQNFSK